MFKILPEKNDASLHHESRICSDCRLGQKPGRGISSVVIISFCRFVSRRFGGLRSKSVTDWMVWVPSRTPGRNPVHPGLSMFTGVPLSSTYLFLQLHCDANNPTYLVGIKHDTLKLVYMYVYYIDLPGNIMMQILSKSLTVSRVEGKNVMESFCLSKRRHLS